jgi:soluble lytic murein transglycosylase-like protein
MTPSLLPVETITSKIGLTLTRFAVLSLGALSLQAAAADVYVAYDQAGVPRFATQKLDATYSLYIKDVVPSAAVEASAQKPESDQQRARRKTIEPAILSISKKHNVDPALVRAVAYVESRFQATAVSSAGASGVMQLMPATAARYGVRNRADIVQNIDAGTRYLKDLLVQFDGNLALSVAAYNSGEGTVAKYKKNIPPYRETMLYVPQVLAYYEHYKRTGEELAN